ncbi:MAG: tetratricopeptide repeat protein [Gammaproteobacteria bacterium]|nr:tetratricopeptide repeat protein [Gammaproteobacteria bacterium]
MSLINDMLKNLERKGKRQSSPDYSFSDLTSTLSIELSKNRNSYFIIASLLSVLALFLTFTTSLKHRAHAMSTEVIASTPKPSPLLKPIVAENAGTDIPISSTLLTGIAMQIQQNNTFLRFLLNQNAMYRLSTNMEHNELIIIFEHTTLTAALPKINYAGSGIENISAYNDNEGNLKLVLQLNTAADLKRLELNKEGSAPELQLDILFSGDANTPISQSAEPHTIPVTIKKPVLESRTEQLYQEAIALASSGQSDEAIQALENLLATTPTYLSARKQLVTLLLLQGKNAEAHKTLDTGLKLQPNDPELTELAARLLVEDKKIDQAVRLLEKSAPSITQHADYHALMAALYERQGKNSLAANLYKQLLTLQPTNAKWWLGLGIALEGTGRQAESLEAFAKADNIGGLNPELKAYIQSRLQTD